jgi:2-oxoglutarate dehydrogenase E2 component (dihydrolipoamide succinyltransferase)
MTIELKIPEVGESIKEVQIGRWLHEEGDFVAADADLLELETDKASMELPAPKSCVIKKILKREGEMVSVGEVVAYLEEQAAPSPKSAAKKPTEPAAKNTPPTDATRPSAQSSTVAPSPTAQPSPASTHPPRSEQAHPESAPSAATTADKSRERPSAVSTPPITPAARRALREHGLTADDIDVSGPRITHDDVIASLTKESTPTAPPRDALVSKPARIDSDAVVATVRNAPPFEPETSREQLVPMSLIRRRIAERLTAAQHDAALLTTFNEIDLSAVKELRKTHGEGFQKKHGVKLGFMSFFVKAVVDALQQTPELNAEIRGDHIAYRNYYHVGVAIGAEKGLVVPVLRHAERLSFAQIELAISDFARRADANKLSPGELVDGTFTITNGGVYGSLLSTPIVNPPQSGVLGMHSIQDRPVALNGQVVIRPMMYVALTYDHRIVDGRGAVTFLKRVKDAIEEPTRMLIEA